MSPARRTPASILHGIAAYGLPGGPDRIAGRLTTPEAWARLLHDAAAQRITGHLVHAAARDALVVDDDQWEQARLRHEQALALDLLLERLAVDVSGRLTAAGIEHRCLKGPILAHTAYPDPALRSFGDVDVLVESSRYDEAVLLLAGERGRPRFREPRPGFTSRFGKGVCVETPDGFEIDVHRALVAGPFGISTDTGDLFAPPTFVAIGGASLPGLPRTPLFLHACYHAALGDRSPRLAALRDVAQLLTGGVDVDDVLTMAARWRALAVVQRALRLLSEHLGVAPAGALAVWAEGYAPDRFERSALRAYVSADRSYAAQAAAGFWALRSLPDRAAYVRALLLPDPEYVRERDGGYVGRLRRGVHLARQWRPHA